MAMLFCFLIILSTPVIYAINESNDSFEKILHFINEKDFKSAELEFHKLKSMYSKDEYCQSFLLVESEFYLTIDEPEKAFNILKNYHCMEKLFILIEFIKYGYPKVLSLLTEEDYNNRILDKYSSRKASAYNVFTYTFFFLMLIKDHDALYEWYKSYKNQYPINFDKPDQYNLQYLLRASILLRKKIEGISNLDKLNLDYTNTILLSLYKLGVEGYSLSDVRNELKDIKPKYTSLIRTKIINCLHKKMLQYDYQDFPCNLENAFKYFQNIKYEYEQYLSIIKEKLEKK